MKKSRFFEGLGPMNSSTRCYHMRLIFTYFLINSMMDSFFITGLSIFTSEDPKIHLKVCAVRSLQLDKSIDEFCPNMEEGNIKCVIVHDRSDCLRKLINGEVDFAVLKPEDLLAGQRIIEDKILITHDLRMFEKKKESVEMVALVNENIKSLADLKGKRLCHPGFDSTNENSTPMLLNYLQNQLIPNKCETNLSFLENRIATLSEYYESACLAGIWASDDVVDKRLQEKYPNLCALCDNPTGCYSDDKYYGRTGALLCLTENAGDIAWVPLTEALYHLKQQDINRTMYNYLCPDGSLRTADGGLPCSWISKPSPVIAARRESAEKVARIIDSIKHYRCKWQPELMELLTPHEVSPVLHDPFDTPEEFLRQYPAFLTAESGGTCRPSRTIKFCVSSNLEEKKCTWLRDLAFSHGIEPAIACHLEENRENSVKAVAKDVCDFFVAQPEDLEMALENDLTSILEIFPRNKDNINKVGIVVKKNSKLRSIEDMRDSTVCLSSPKSLGWNAFVQIMVDETNDTLWKCSSKAAMSKYFKSIIYSDSNREDIDSISSTYDCLKKGTGDVAIVSLLDKDSMLKKGLRTICLNRVNEPGCYLTWTTLGSIMVNNKMPEMRRDEIRLMVQDLVTYFGKNVSGREAAISLYGPFDSHDNVIFPNKSDNMWRDADHLDFERNYIDIWKQISANMHSTLCSSAESFSSNVAILPIITIFLFIIYY